jgi:hypothetical protein
LVIPEPSSLSLTGLAALLALPYACRRWRRFLSRAVTGNNS